MDYKKEAALHNASMNHKEFAFQRLLLRLGLKKMEAIVNRICATIIMGFIFSLALSVTLPTAASISQPQNEGRININTASIEELQRLPGVGAALASRIVEHRRRHGLFKRPQDIVIVRGMSARLYRRIAQLIRV